MAEGKDIGFWHSPAVKPLSEEQIRDIAESLNLQCSTEEITVYTASIKEALKSYDRLNELIEPTLPVKYPRTSGYRPQQEDNALNAWYYRCEIKGFPTGRLIGKRVGIKDNTAVAGIPMMNGSKIMEGYVPEYDATIVTRILDAGGEIVGKTACEDLCLSAGGFNNSLAPTLNPHNHENMTSGSSSGSAVLLSTGEIDLATGGDQGGSIRLPASWCGVVGLKPTYGLVPYTGCVPIEYTLDHCGPMARTVKDCALLLEVMAGYDNGRDPRQFPNISVPEYSKMLDLNLNGKRVGLVKEGFTWASEDVRRIVSTAAENLSQFGADVKEISIPVFKDAIHIWAGIAFEGGYQTLVRDKGHTVGWKGHYMTSLLDKLGQAYATRTRDMSEVLRQIAIVSEYMNKAYHGRFYAKAQNLSRYLSEEIDRVFDDVDVVVMPTVPTTAQKIPKTDSTLAERLLAANAPIINTAPFNVTGHPSISVNSGWSDGLPVGMMITGRKFEDATVLQLAYAVENIAEKSS